MNSLLRIAFFLLVTVVGVLAESHTVRFNNRCGRGTPKLIRGPTVLSTGGQYTSNGPLIGAIAYLDTGCLFNGEHCMTVEMTLKNPNPGSPGSGSSVDLSLIPPLAYNVPASFSYYGGCDGQGRSCNNAGCNTAFHIPTDTFTQVGCQANNVNLQINFC